MLADRPPDGPHRWALQASRGGRAWAALDTRTQRTFVDYQRALDFVEGVHVARFGTPGRRVLGEAFASRPADVMVFRYSLPSRVCRVLQRCASWATRSRPRPL